MDEITRDEAHVLVDAALNFDNTDYDVMVQVSTGRCGRYADVAVFKMYDEIKLLESKQVPRDISVWDAVKMIARYKEEKRNA